MNLQRSSLTPSKEKKVELIVRIRFCLLKIQLKKPPTKTTMLNLYEESRNLKKMELFFHFHLYLIQYKLTLYAMKGFFLFKITDSVQ